MSRRQITPLEFGGLIQAAQAYRADGMSQIEAATQACRYCHISDDWAAPLLGFLNDSPTAAEAWASRIFSETLQRAAGRIEA
jgi:hypothetical protein